MQENTDRCEVQPLYCVFTWIASRQLQPGASGQDTQAAQFAADPVQEPTIPAAHLRHETWGMPEKPRRFDETRATPLSRCTSGRFGLRRDSQVGFGEQGRKVHAVTIPRDSGKAHAMTMPDHLRRGWASTE
jgi:hypothetical protein